MKQDDNKMILCNQYFCLKFDTDQGTLRSLVHPNDVFSTNYLAENVKASLGSWEAEYQCNGKRESVHSCEGRMEMDSDSHAVYLAQHGEKLSVRQSFFLTEESQSFSWELKLKNHSAAKLEIEDFRLSFPMNSDFVRDAEINYTRRVIRHSFISASGSYIYWQRPNGAFPCLTMVCGKGTFLVDFDHDTEDIRPGWAGTYRVYVHSRKSKRKAAAGNNTRTILGPGEERTFCFLFRWAKDYEGIRRIVYESGRPDVISIPGMVVPEGMDAYLAVRMKGEYMLEPPEGMCCRFSGKKGQYDIYRLRFSKIGEAILSVVYGEEKTYLEFFHTVSLRQLIQSRADHIVGHQQYKGREWFDGLFSLWNMEKEFMLTPSRQDGIPPYCTGGADDPGLCKAAYVAQKNYYFPSDTEIEAVEYYMEHFLWGGLQRKEEEEPYPYGVYGSDFWHQNRKSNSGYGNGGHGQERMWRTFDYTHIIGLYRYMYLIARQYPAKVHYLDWKGYLSRAYHTAIAFFEIPYSIFMKNGWDFRGYTDWAFKQGNFHEIHIPYLIRELEEEGYTDWAGKLRGYWEQKVMYMIYSHPYPFGSEMWFDTTAFESVHGVAKYALENQIDTPVVFYDKNQFGPGAGGERIYSKIEKDKTVLFMKKGIHANLAARGCLGPVYYHMGSDVRASGDNQYQLSYMSQLGGWAIMDYGLYYAESERAHYLRCAYASFLSSFMLIHTGESYPWYPSGQNEGAAGWAFEPEREGRTWLNKKILVEHGPWPYDGEIDNGFQGALRTACSICYEDSVFGLVYLGGRMILKAREKKYIVYPGDGIRRDVFFLCFGYKLHLSSRTHEICEVLFNGNFDSVEIGLESVDAGVSEGSLSVEAMGADESWQMIQAEESGRYTVRKRKVGMEIQFNGKERNSIVKIRRVR